MTTHLDNYRLHVAERIAKGLPPLPLHAEQVGAIAQLFINAGAGMAEQAEWVEAVAQRVLPGVDEAAKVKADFLYRVACGSLTVPALTPAKACSLLGTMVGGYAVQALVKLLDVELMADLAGQALSRMTFVFDNFNDVTARADRGHPAARAVINAWAEADWFNSRPEVPRKIDLVVFKVEGETMTDDLSPATDVSTRPDIPLHALTMLKHGRMGVVPDEPGVRGPLAQLDLLRMGGRRIVYAGDIVGTGSSRKSAVNSLIWHTGDDIPFVPNRRTGGVCLAGQFAPIFFNTYEDAGGLPIEMDVGGLYTGDLVTLLPHEGMLLRGAQEIESPLRNAVLLDEFRAGGRIALIVGRALTAKAREHLGLSASRVFQIPAAPRATSKGFTLAQKLVGRACGLAEDEGIVPGSYCEPRVGTVGSPDTTGPLTRSELKDLACLSFGADLVVQSFCHTVAYPNSADLRVQRELPPFYAQRGGLVLKPGDGVIHSLLNRLLLPDQLGTGGDSHTRFPIGLSLPAGSGLVAFAAATGVMPLDMPESVLVQFKGCRRPGITIRDLVHAIPLFARRAGLLTLEKRGKRNVFSGRILEIRGLEHLSVDEAFELTDASAERSAAGATVELGLEAVAVHQRAGIAFIDSLLQDGYGPASVLERRRKAMQKWLAAPYLVRADMDAQYAAVLEIDLDEIDEPIICCPNDPDDARFLSNIHAGQVDEVFIGSCMTRASHFRNAAALVDPGKDAAVRLWIAPPTRMDASELSRTGTLDIFTKIGARTEIPGCSLCMGNQARVRDGATVVSTSTRNFPNRMGKNANVYLASAEVAALSASLGRLPTRQEYQSAQNKFAETQ